MSLTHRCPDCAGPLHCPRCVATWDRYAWLYTHCPHCAHEWGPQTWRVSHAQGCPVGASTPRRGDRPAHSAP